MKYLLFCTALLMPSLIHAECTGVSFEDMMTPEERAEVEAQVEAAPFSSGTFWKAEKADRIVHLIGTMHLPDARLQAVYDEVRPVLDSVQILYVEAGPDETARLQSAMTSDPTIMFNQDGQTLPELLSEEEWRKTREAIAERGIPSVLAAKMNPWFVTLTLSIPSCVMPEVAAGKAGLDQMIMHEATELELPIKALEAWDTAIHLMADDSLEDQLLGLRVAVSAPELTKASFIAMLEHYFEEETTEIMAMSRILAHRTEGLSSEEAEAVYSEMENDLLITRNLDWMKRLRADKEHDKIAIAVGAAHLQGEYGLLKLLQDDGWRITEH